MSRASNWPTEVDDAKYAVANRRGRIIGATLVSVFVAGVLSLVLIWHFSQQTRAVPALVTHRSRLSSCGAYKAEDSLPGTSPTTTPQQGAVDGCILASIRAGRQAEATVTEPPDDTRTVAVLYFRVIAPGRAEVIIEEIPTRGPIEARVTPCRTIEVLNGSLTCS